MVSQPEFGVICVNGIPSEGQVVGTLASKLVTSDTVGVDDMKALCDVGPVITLLLFPFIGVAIIEVEFHGTCA